MADATRAWHKIIPIGAIEAILEVVSAPLAYILYLRPKALADVSMVAAKWLIG